MSQEAKNRVRRSANKEIGILPPPPICNDDLYLIRNSNAIHDENKMLKLEKEMTAGGLERNKRVLKKDLELNKHYRGVNKEVWELLHKIYGGGPCVVREELDIYGQDRFPDYQVIVKKERYQQMIGK